MYFILFLGYINFVLLIFENFVSIFSYRVNISYRRFVGGDSDYGYSIMIFYEDSEYVSLSCFEFLIKERYKLGFFSVVKNILGKIFFFFSYYRRSRSFIFFKYY